MSSQNVDVAAAKRALLSSGAINENEEIGCTFSGSFSRGAGWCGGWAFVTDRRFVFGRRAPGLFSKGIDLIFECSLGDILSVTTGGLLDKRVNLSIRQNGQPMNYSISCSANEVWATRIIDAKKAYKEKETVVAHTIVIEEAKKEKASEILQKRLARGEIELDEFHRIIQRT